MIGAELENQVTMGQRSHAEGPSDPCQLSLKRKANSGRVGKKTQGSGNRIACKSQLRSHFLHESPEQNHSMQPDKAMESRSLGSGHAHL